LLDRLIVESAAGGFRQMVAVIGDSAQVASIALHRAAGFSMVGTLEAVGYKFGRWLDTVLMQRPIGDERRQMTAAERGRCVVRRLNHSSR
jgi:phosphinothricin acetyltransferase